jgi:hypothetical protein
LAGALSPRGDACEWYGVSPALWRRALAERDPRAADGNGGRSVSRTRRRRALYLAQRHLFRRVKHSPPTAYA